MHKIILAGVVSVALAGCDRMSGPAENGNDDTSASTTASPSAGAFAHSQTQDLSGYYQVGEAQVGPGDFALMHVFVGQVPEFRDWEDGKRSDTFAPVMLEFLVPGETTERVLPDSYSVSDGRVRMSGVSEDYGRVTFDGQLDTGALATARRNLGAGEDAAMTAVVTIGGQSWSGVKLGWTGGD